MSVLPSAVPPPDVAVIGGSGLYHLFDDAVEVLPDTPWGPPSAPVTVAVLGARSVAFLPRHGRRHEVPAHRVPARANLWALRSLGVRQVLGPCAVGSLHSDLGAGHLVVPDQLLDRTRGRESTYYDAGAVHVPFADPYCPVLRAGVLAAASLAGWSAVDGGTMAVVPGPRFSTRAESRELAAAGADLVNMTALPEAALARELALCYASVALVTDLDAGAADGDGVTQADVLATFAGRLPQLSEVLRRTAEALPVQRHCACPLALDGIPLPWELP